MKPKPFLLSHHLTLPLAINRLLNPLRASRTAPNNLDGVGACPKPLLELRIPQIRGKVKSFLFTSQAFLSAKQTALSEEGGANFCKPPRRSWRIRRTQIIEFCAQAS